MTKQEDIYRQRWWNRLQKSKRSYFFEKSSEEENVSVFKKFVCFKNDAIYVFRWTFNILIQIRMYGADIKRNYHISFLRQFSRMAYLAFVIRVNPRNFRKYRLFKQKNWSNVDDYAFAHVNVQRTFSNALFPDEIDLFLNKFLFFQFCREYDFRSPSVLAAYENGRCIFSEFENKQLPKEDLFIKKMNGMMGMGAKKLLYQDGVYTDNRGNRYNEESLFNLLEETSIKNYPVLLQHVIKNHPSWSKFTSGALATCRIVTYRTPDSSEIKPLFATFRMPVGTMHVDNFSAGGIAAPVDVKTGMLGTLVGSKPINGFYEFTHHPDTKQRVEGTVLPEWIDLLAFALKMHRKVRSAFVGWDICLTDHGCCVLEGSLEWGVSTYESPYEKPIKNTQYPEIFEKWMETCGNHE